MAAEFLKLRGRARIAERLVSGAPGNFYDPGCPAQLAVAMSEEVNEIREKCSGVDGVAYRDVTAQNAEITLTLYKPSKRNLMLALQGTDVSAVTSGTVTGEAAPALPAIGDFVRLGGADGHQNITSLVVNDNAVPMTVDVDYTLKAASGMVEFLTAPTGPVTFNYAYDDLPKVPMFTAAGKEYYVAFDARNKADNFNAGIAELYRVRFAPIANLDLLPDEVTQIELVGSVLIDETRDVDDVLGQFGWFALVGA